MGEQWIDAGGVSAKRTNMVPVREGEKFLYTGNGQEEIPSVIWYDDNQQVLRREQYAANDSFRLITVSRIRSAIPSTSSLSCGCAISRSS